MERLQRRQLQPDGVRQAERRLCCSEEAGLTEDDARYAGRALVQAGYIEGHVPLEDDDPKQYVVEHSSH